MVLAALAAPVCTIVLFIIIGCAYTPVQEDSAPSVDDQGRWIKDGLIVISRRAPEISMAEGRAALGFAPVQGAHVGSWLSVNRADNSLRLMDGEKAVATVTAQGAERLEQGLYQLQHKQRNPLWYAPDNYFSTRHLQIPAEGDKSRFRRGALGDFVLFINKETPIHCGPIWSDMIGGLRVDESDISKLYYALDVGSIVEVK